jgi:formate hydrogenlyase subunit 4
MMNYIKGITASMTSGILSILQGTIIRSLKIEALKLYVKAVGVARNFNIIVMASIALLLLAMVSFVMIHVGIMILLPYSLEVKGWIILILGIVYGLISYTFIGNICSEKTWLDISKASDMINDVVKTEGDKKD